LKVIQISDERERVQAVKELIRSAGNKIGSVHFKKRSTGELRKMCYRLHTQKPAYATKPSGKRHISRKAKDSEHQMMTVLDVNKVLRDKKGKIAGRGDWRTIPLENVVRVKVDGTIYRIRK